MDGRPMPDKNNLGLEDPIGRQKRLAHLRTQGQGSRFLVACPRSEQNQGVENAARRYGQFAPPYSTLGG